MKENTQVLCDFIYRFPVNVNHRNDKRYLLGILAVLMYIPTLGGRNRKGNPVVFTNIFKNVYVF